VHDIGVALTRDHALRRIGFAARVYGWMRTCAAHDWLGLEDELVVAGGAMRLYGTLGPIPADGPRADVSQLVAGADIQSVLLDAAMQAFELPSTHATPAEEL